ETATLRLYASPTAVLLAMDWPGGSEHDDFLGFAIKRTPGYAGAGSSFLYNKITFNGPARAGGPIPTSDRNPIQKFVWWDGGIETADRGQLKSYTVTPVLGTGEADAHLLVEAAV